MGLAELIVGGLVCWRLSLVAYLCLSLAAVHWEQAIEAEGLAILAVKYESLGAAYGQGGKGSMVCI